MDPKAPSGPDGRVLQFRPRAQPPVRDPHWSPVEDLHKYTQTRDEDYRHRMLMNLIAVLVALVLVGCGIWLMNAIVQMRKVQDCVLSGRRNCMTIDAPINSR